MSTFILTWNPAISEYKMDQFHHDLKTVNDGESADLYWPVEEYEDCQEGDRFFMIRTGRGHTGICMAGYFYSDPFEDDDHSDSSKRYISGIDPLVWINTDEADHISLDTLKTLLPKIKWDRLESGTLISDEDAAIIEEAWLNYLYKHQDIFNGYAAGKSWDFDLEDFESIPEPLQVLYKETRGNVCEKCGRKEEEVDEMAYHLVLNEDYSGSTPLEKMLHCYCNECWFGED